MECFAQEGKSQQPHLSCRPAVSAVLEDFGQFIVLSLMRLRLCTVIGNDFSCIHLRVLRKQKRQSTRTPEKAKTFSPSPACTAL
jgi:hypothetical protein